ncbi:hypothetical protein FZC74_07425 [Sutcliffiella horikoshii]|uniref:Uncharacterized protein n=1 Tax=Sutcliffiella horikoshii TaxID=79883 RepID=A0AA95B717_9BACI|nr:hypothetical protein [Sutcliffiella horikoshii]TYS59976.1 hypothetical protein FZC74_07425 [Sutcliffiella horikoshii]
MQKSYLVIVLTCLLLVFSACSETEEKEIVTNNEKNTETQESTSENTGSADTNEDEEETEEEKPEEDSSTEEDESETPSDPGFKIYQPSVGWEKKFTDGEDIVVTEKVIAANDEYVQLAMMVGGNQSIQIYKWTPTEVALVYEEISVDDASVNLLDSFTPNGNPEVLLSETSAQWELVESGVKLDVVYGSFEDVYVIKKVTDEVENADTIYTRYYAPGYGLVKETYEVTGEYGYSGKSELEVVEK